MENQIFEKRSFWNIFGLSLVTFGIYYLYYFIRTTKQLRKAGNQVPSLWLLFLPVFIYAFLEAYLIAQSLINGINNVYILLICLRLASYVPGYYFWFGYIKAYCRTIKYNSSPSYVWKYFLTFVAASWATFPLAQLISYTPVVLYITSHPWVIIPVYALFFLYGSASTYLLFQKGFNQYLTQEK